jgi:predicted dehydrogenase
MKQLNVFQIGLGDFGRYGFEKFVEMHNHLEEVDVVLHGVADSDFERLEDAKKFADAHDVELKTFRKASEMYEEASKVEGEVFIYDAGPSGMHADHIYQSINRGFFHLAEKPPSLTRDEHLKEKKLAKNKDVFWTVDFIERENPVVRQAVKELKGTDIESIDVFRESTVGVQKLLQKVERAGVKGGDILDKMTHEIYVLDFLESADIYTDLELVDSRTNYMMPWAAVSDNLMDIYGGKTRNIDTGTATAQTQAVFSAGDTEISLNSSWLGVSREARQKLEELELSYSPVNSEIHQAGEDAFVDEEARFFVVNGERNLFGDMLNFKLVDLDRNDTVELPELLHDQLYRVIEQAVKKAAGMDVETIGEREIDVFMDAIFDLREEAVNESDSFGEELARAKEKVRSLMYEGNLLEDTETETVTG